VFIIVKKAKKMISLNKKTKSIFFKGERKELNRILISSIVLDVVQLLGIALIFPFMSMVLDTKIIFEKSISFLYLRSV
jgi:hypothetical protein